MRSLFAFFLLLMTTVSACSDSETVIHIDATQRFQKMVGWETAVDVQWPPEFQGRQDELFHRAIEEIGITRLRVSIYSGAENTNRAWQRFLSGQISYEVFRTLRYATVNDNADPYTIDPAGFDFTNLDWRMDQVVMPMRKLLEAQGERLFINLNYIAFTYQTRNGAYHHDDPEEYAEFVLATYLHMQKKYGVVPDAWEVILEPDLVPEWHRDPTLIGVSMVAAAKRLREHGFTPSFIAPSVTDMANAVPYFEAILSVPGARELLSEFSYHRYRHNDMSTLNAIAAASEAEEIPTSMLEWWFGNGDQQVLFDDLTVANNASWQGRLLQGHFDIDETGRFRMKDEVRYNSLFMAFVRPGAVRIGAEHRGGDSPAVAFVNPDGSTTVTASVRNRGRVIFDNLPTARYRLFWATTQDCANAIPFDIADGQTLTFDMPGEGVIAVTSLPEHPATGSEFLSRKSSSRCPDV